MTRTLLILIVGLGAGLAAHVGWFAAHRPVAQADLGAQLAWMQGRLRLTDAQLARIKAVHEQSAPRLLALAAEVETMRGELAAFERERRTTGRVDFLEFARFVEQRRTLDRECATSTERLVVAATEVMTPEQRERYLRWLQPAFAGNRGVRVN